MKNLSAIDKEKDLITKEWVTAQGYLKSVGWADIQGKPTTIAGYGITDAPTKTGSGASGTWGISISGNSATATALNREVLSDLNNATKYRVFESASISSTNVPVNGWINGITFARNNNSEYRTQLAIADATLYTRLEKKGEWGNWVTIYGSNNSNNTSIDWKAKALTLAGAITGATTGAFSSDVTVGGTLGVTGISTLKGIALTNGTKTVNLSVDTDGNLKIDGNAYATGALSAGGKGEGGQGGGGGTVVGVKLGTTSYNPDSAGVVNLPAYPTGVSLGLRALAYKDSLGVADIPQLEISKVNGLQAVLDNKASASALSSYLPLSGGRLTGELTTNGDRPWILGGTYEGASSIGYLKCTSSGKNFSILTNEDNAVISFYVSTINPRVSSFAPIYVNENIVYHAGNLPAYPTTLPASDVSAWAKSTTLQAADVPNLAASKITSGTFDTARIPSLAINKITDLQTTLDGKQATISDLATIRSNAGNGQTAFGWGNHASAGYQQASTLFDDLHVPVKAYTLSDNTGNLGWYTIGTIPAASNARDRYTTFSIACRYGVANFMIGRYSATTVEIISNHSFFSTSTQYVAPRAVRVLSDGKVQVQFMQGTNSTASIRNVTVRAWSMYTTPTMPDELTEDTTDYSASGSTVTVVGSLSFVSHYTQLPYLKVDNRIGIGKTPTEALDVVGNITATGSLSGETGNISSSLNVGGNVGIGTTSPTEKLYVSGNIVATGAITAGAASDLRLKSNVTTILNATDVLRSLRGVEFNWNKIATENCKDLNGHDVGMIAQEVEPYIPSAIGSIFGEYERLDYTKITPYLVEGWKSHDNEIARLKARVEELEAQVKQMKFIY